MIVENMSDQREALASQRAWLTRVTTAVNALARHRNPETASWRQVKKAILEAATNLRLEASQNTPPIQLDKIKQVRHIYEEASFISSGSLNAVLTPSSRGFILRIQEGQNLFRQRFSIAHEIGHTFFYDINKNPPVRLISQVSSGVLSPKEEDICSAFARELLIPRELIDRELFKLSDNNKLMAILDLGNRYGVSAEVMTRRLLMDLSQLETTAAIFKGEDNLGRQRVKVYIRLYKGKALRSYLRQKERPVFNEVLKICEGAPPYSALDKLASLHSDIASIQWKASMTGAQLIVFLTFNR
jgi:Zn-dependent peptidase ImmA (M78 family)